MIDIEVDVEPDHLAGGQLEGVGQRLRPGRCVAQQEDCGKRNRDQFAENPVYAGCVDSIAPGAPVGRVDCFRRI